MLANFGLVTAIRDYRMLWVLHDTGTSASLPVLERFREEVDLRFHDDWSTRAPTLESIDKTKQASGIFRQRRQRNVGQIRFDLDPSRLPNPDLEIRYRLPDALAAIPASTIKDDGYDYSDHEPPLLMIYLLSDKTDSDLKLAIDYLGQHQLSGNNVLDAATIYTSDDGENWSQSFPAA